MGFFTKTSGTGWSLDKGSGRLTISGDLSDAFRPFEKIAKMVRSVVALDGARVRKGSWLFSYMKKLESADLSKLDVSMCKEMQYMFCECTSLTSMNLAGWKTAKDTDMRSMFSNCKSLTSIDITGWDTSNVRDMSGMFWGCKSLVSVDLTALDLSNVETLEKMFCFCEKLTHVKMGPLSAAGKLADIRDMFSYCKNLRQVETPGWPSKSLKKCRDMFRECEALEELDLRSMDVTNVENINCMFQKCSNLRALDLSGWDTRNLKEMALFCERCKSLETLDLRGWHIKKGTDAGSAFYEVPNNVRILVNDKTTQTVLSEQWIRTVYIADPANADGTGKESAVKEEPKAATKVEAKPEVKAEPKAEAKPAVEKPKAAAKPESKTMVKPETKAEPKPAAKKQSKKASEPKAEAKPEPKEKPKAETKTEVAPAPQPAAESGETQALKEQLARQQAEMEALKAQLAALQAGMAASAVQPEAEANPAPAEKPKKKTTKKKPEAAPKAESKPEPKPEPKPVPKAEPSPEERFNALWDGYKKGDAEAIYQIALCFRDGIGTEKNEFYYLHSLIKADVEGNKEAHRELSGVDADTVYRYGYELSRQKKYSEAYPFFMTAGKLGNAHAWFEIGHQYEEGLVFEKNLAQAAKFYHIGAERNDPPSQAFLSKMLLLGEGVEQDFDKALFWAKKANESEELKGSELVNGLLGEINKQIAHRAYKAGVAAYNAANYTEAMRQTLAAAEMGHGSAQYNLALMYMKGQGTKTDYTKALSWAKKAKESGQLSPDKRIDELINALEAESLKTNLKSEMQTQAEAGDVNAMVALASSYLYGYAGMPQNAVEAFYWASKAKKSGKLDAKNTELMDLIINNAETVFADKTHKHLRPDEIRDLFGGLDAETAESMAGVVNFIAEAIAVHKNDIDSEGLEALFKKLPVSSRLDADKFRNLSRDDKVKFLAGSPELFRQMNKMAKR